MPDPADEAFLDDRFERAVTARSNGTPLDLDSILVGREQLRESGAIGARTRRRRRPVRSGAEGWESSTGHGRRPCAGRWRSRSSRRRRRRPRRVAIASNSKRVLSSGFATRASWRCSTSLSTSPAKREVGSAVRSDFGLVRGEVDKIHTEIGVFVGTRIFAAPLSCAAHMTRSAPGPMPIRWLSPAANGVPTRRGTAST